MSRPDHDRLERIRRALDTLPEPAAEVFRLHALEEQDYAAIAARLGLSIAEVERRLAEAICLIDGELRRPDRDRAS